METLKEVWQSQGLTATNVADQAGVSLNTLYRMNRKDDTVSIPSIVKVCKVLKISMDYYKSLEAEQ